MGSSEFSHTPVLLKEVLSALKVQEDGVYVDATFGRGGHSRAILEILGRNGRLFVFDKDPDSLPHARRLAETDKRVMYFHASFSEVLQHLEQENLLSEVDGILFDLGVSSPQLDDAQRGFSFSRDGDLDMRMNPESGISAADWINSAERDEIVRVLKDYGEERFAKRIANRIVRCREEERISRTLQLADIIVAAVPGKEKEKHPATRSFQAIRIFVNNELGELSNTLDMVLSILKPGGRLAVISFHSLEDRIVKRFMREQSRGDDFPPDLPVTVNQLNPRMKLIGKALRAGEDEINRNPRARSAVLRVAEKIAA